MIPPISTSDISSAPASSAPDQAMRQLFERHEGRALYCCDWEQPLVLHLEVEPDQLARLIPYELDLYHGRAFVSLLTLRMSRIRMCSGGRFILWTGSPWNQARLLNVRTCVRHLGIVGMYELGLWMNRSQTDLTNALLANPTWPAGLVELQTNESTGQLHGQVTCGEDPSIRLAYEGQLQAGQPMVPPSGSLDDFLLNRSILFSGNLTLRRQIRFCHEPWLVRRAQVRITDDRLLSRISGWRIRSQVHCAHAAVSLTDVWISRPRCINGPACARLWSTVHL